MKLNNNLDLDIERDIIQSPMLVAGMRGWGKTQFVRWLLSNIDEQEYRVIILDSEGDYDFGNVIVVQDPNMLPNMYNSCTLDISSLSYYDKLLFSKNLVESLCIYQQDKPTIFVMEEAQHLVPEKGRSRVEELRDIQNDLLYWTLELAATGRHRGKGVGYIAICRRKAEVSKDIIMQCDTLVLSRIQQQDAKDFGLAKQYLSIIDKLELGSYLVRKNGSWDRVNIKFLPVIKRQVKKDMNVVTQERPRFLEFLHGRLEVFKTVDFGLFLIMILSLVLGKYLGVLILGYLVGKYWVKAQNR